jgi:hypothetical protein
MEQPSQIPPTPTPSKPTIQSVAKLYFQKGKEFLTLAKGRLNEDPKMRKLLTLTGGAFGVIILLFILGAVAQNVIKRAAVKPTPTPTSEASAAPVPTLFNPSRYATDSAVLALEESVRGINRDAESLDIREYNLRPPDLDFDINFQNSQ